MAHQIMGDGVPTMKNTLQSYSKNIDFNIEDDMFYITPDTEYVFGVILFCGNFSHPIYSVSKASVPSVRCSNKSSSDSASFSPPLSLRKPLRPRVTPAA